MKNFLASLHYKNLIKKYGKVHKLCKVLKRSIKKFLPLQRNADKLVRMICILSITLISLQIHDNYWIHLNNQNLSMPCFTDCNFDGNTWVYYSPLLQTCLFSLLLGLPISYKRKLNWYVESNKSGLSSWQRFILVILKARCVLQKCSSILSKWIHKVLTLFSSSLKQYLRFIIWCALILELKTPNFIIWMRN